MWLLFPGGFPHFFRGSEQKWPCRDLWPRTARSWSPFFNKPSRSNHHHFCVHQTHRLCSSSPQQFSGGASPVPHSDTSLCVFATASGCGLMHTLLRCCQVTAECCPTILSGAIAALTAIAQSWAQPLCVPHPTRSGNSCPLQFSLVASQGPESLIALCVLRL